MGFSLMVAVQEEMQTWDTDEQDKLESIIEKRSSLDLDLSLGLGIFLSTIGPINDFFVKSQFKQIKLNQGTDFDKKVSRNAYPILGSYDYWSCKAFEAFEPKEVIVTHMHAVCSFDFLSEIYDRGEKVEWTRIRTACMCVT